MDPDGSLIGSWELWVLVVLVAFSAFFSASETALTSMNRIRLRSLVDQDVAQAKVVSQILEMPNKVIAAILIGNNVVNILASTIATALAIALVGPIGAGYAAIIMTLVILIFGEIIPKSIAVRFQEEVALRVGRPIRLLTQILSPLVTVFDGLSRLVIKLLGGGDSSPTRVTEEEIQTIINIGQEEGLLGAHERELIRSVFDFGETTAEEVMVPRIDMHAIPITASMEMLAEAFAEKQYSRIPVYDGTIENIVGAVHLKDFVRHRTDANVTVADLIRPVIFVPETLEIEKVFGRMKRQRISTAIVLDEYSQTVGMITPTDIIEEIMGRFADEHDGDEDDIVTLTQGDIEVDGGYLIDDLNDECDFGIEEDVANTIGGYIFYKLGRVPKINDRLRLSDRVEAVVIGMSDKRVSKVRLIRIPPETPPTGTSKSSTTPT